MNTTEAGTIQIEGIVVKYHQVSVREETPARLATYVIEYRGEARTCEVALATLAMLKRTVEGLLTQTVEHWERVRNRELVSEDVRRSYPEMTDDETLAHARNTVDVNDLDGEDDDDLVKAYRDILTREYGDGMTQKVGA